MAPIVESIIIVLEHSTDPEAVQDALRNAAFLFEKARGLAPCGWPDEVIEASPSKDYMRSLQNAVVAYVERTGVGSWTLGKCFDPEIKPVLVAVLRRQLVGDAGELFQALIALYNLGEPVFGQAHSFSIRDESRNREFARAYLSRCDPPR